MAYNFVLTHFPVLDSPFATHTSILSRTLYRSACTFPPSVRNSFTPLLIEHCTDHNLTFLSTIMKFYVE